MARYMKIPQFFGHASDILLYSSECQFDSIEYYKKIKKINGITILDFNGDTDYLLSKFNSLNGWFPQVGSTFFIKFFVPQNTDMFSKNIGIFGSGDFSDIERNDFWGLSIKTNPETRTKNFYLTISNLLQIHDIPFKNYDFNSNTIYKNQFNTITLLQNSNNAKLYINGNLVSKVQLPFLPETNTQYNNIYIGRYGNTTEYSGFKAYIKEIGLWERPIDNRDVIDLNKTNFISNKGTTKKSKRIKIDAGKFYYDGYIHNIDETSIYIDGENKETIYILIKENLVTEEEDPELLDNSSNTYNLGKPGMHRIQYEYSYANNINTAELPDGTYAIKFLEFNDGVKIFSLLDKDVPIIKPEENTNLPAQNDIIGKSAVTPSSNEKLLELMSKYLYEIFGNFIYNGLIVSLEDKDLSTYQLAISSGVYYLNGKRYELDKNSNIDISKNSSLTTIVNEYINIRPNKPVLLSQQPVADKYIVGNNLVSGITRALVPTKQKKTVHVSRVDLNGEDIVDVSAIKILHVYKGTSVENATVIYKACSVIDGTDGDYFFYNGRLKWSPHSLNKPNIASNGISVDSYNVEYIKLYSCLEGINNDFVVIKGDKLCHESISYRGKHIIHNLQYNFEHLISATVTRGTNIYKLNASDFTISGTSLKITKDIPFLFPADIIEIHYSYNSLQSVKPFWHVLFFETGTKIIDSSVDGIIDYKYYLSDIYTLAIDNDNIFRLYKGMSGYRGNVIKASIPESSLPIADIVIDPDGSKYCKITPYNIYKTHVIDIKNMMKKLNNLESNIALTELEKIGESKANINRLRGMFVDPLSNYSRSDINGEFDAFIDLVRERLYSGYDLYNKILSINNPNNVKIGKEVYYPITTNQESVIDAQYDNTGEDVINKFSVSDVKAQVSIYNDFSYSQELRSAYVKNILDTIDLSPINIIPVNSEISIMNSYLDEGTVNRSSLIKNTLEKFGVFFSGMGINSQVTDRIIILVGTGFLPNENHITIEINNKLLDSRNITALKNITTHNNEYFANFTENNNEKSIKIENLQFASGWETTEYSGITANSKGEFVVSVLIPASFKLLTGLQQIVLNRYNNKPEPINAIANFSGVIDSLKNIINTNNRGNTTFYNSAQYSTDCVPGIIQPINSITATLTGLSLFFNYIDYSFPIVIDIVELNNNEITKVLYRKTIYNVRDFTKIHNNKYTIAFNSFVNVVANKTYAIVLSTENPSIKINVTEIGKISISSASANSIVSKINPFLSVIGKSNNNLVLSSDGKKGLCYELLSIDNTNSPKNANNYVENIIKFDTLEFAEYQDRFNLNCDYDPTIGYDRKIYAEYSIDSRDILDANKKWHKFSPYVLITPKEKFKTLSIRFIILSANFNYISSIPQYPEIKVYKFKPKSKYFSKYFETGIVDGSEETQVNVFINSETRPESTYSLYVSSDSGLLWKKFQLADTKITGNTTSFILKEEKYVYECKLEPPVVLSHEIMPNIPGSLLNGNFNAPSTVSYLVALLDGNGRALTVKELYNIDNTTRLPVIYNVNNLNGLNQKIKLQIQIDPNCKGFRIYRAINNEGFNQIYSSIAISNIPSSISQSDIDPYKIPVNSILEFPKKGIIKINNELIKYDNIHGNAFVVAEKGRGYFNTTIGEIMPGDYIELYDYAIDHENIFKGQVPRIYSTKKYFEFVDDNITYHTFNRIAKTEEQRHLNDTVSYPSGLNIKIEFDNTNDVIESSSIFNMICNIEKK